MQFNELQTQVFDLYSEGKYPEALALMEREAAKFPEEGWGVSYWWLCLYALLNRPDDALRTLREGLDRGWWHPPNALRTDEDLRSLQTLPEYQALIVRSTEMRDEAQKSVQPHQVIHKPAGTAAAPLIIALHGNNNTAASAEAFWKPMLERGYMLSAMQSTQLGNRENTYVWDEYAHSKQDVEQYYAALARDHNFDASRIIFGGFSMGGQVAARLALEGVFGASGFITVGGWMGLDLELKYVQDLLKSQPPEAKLKIRGAIIIGDQDQGSYKGALKFAELLSAAGISHQLTVLHGLGHVYPENFTESLANAVRFVLDQ